MLLFLGLFVVVVSLARVTFLFDDVSICSKYVDVM